MIRAGRYRWSGASFQAMAAGVVCALLAACAAQQRAIAAAAGPEAGCSASIPEVYERVSPGVVFISATSINPYQRADRMSRTVGSGFLVDPSGLILTNSHVVFGRAIITVTLDDGTTTPGRLIGADPIFDIAVLRIQVPSEERLPTVALGDSDALRVGEEVLAIGNPLGLDQTLTRGIVSAVNRILPDAPSVLLEPLIQTDAPINPGNSGGPLLNRCGEAIGMTSAVIPEAQNIGFAIPINLVKAAMPLLVRDGRLIRPWIGFHGQLVGRALREILRIPLVDGLMVEAVEPGSPAERAGLRGGQLEVTIGGQTMLAGGDIVTRLNGAELRSPEKLYETLRGLKVGEAVKLTVFREGDYRDVEYLLPERPTLPEDIRGQRGFSPLGGPRRWGR